MTRHDGLQNRYRSEPWDNMMPLTAFSDWFDILKNDDVTGYDSLMAALSEQKEKLVNGHFVYANVGGGVHKTNNWRNINYCSDFRRPLILAAAFGSRGVFMKLLRDGAPVTQAEENSCNCIHAMIIATAEYRDREGQILGTYLDIRKNIELEKLRVLLFTEANDHMRPVELAVRLGAFGIFRAIMETEGVYEKPAGTVGLTNYVTYDMDVYENNRNWRREIRSPLRLLRYMENDQMASFIEYGVIQMPVIKAWSQRKKMQSWPFILLWFVCKVVFLFFYLLIDPRSFKAMALGGCAVMRNISYQDHIPLHWACSDKYVKPGRDPNIMLKLLMYFTGFAMLFSVIFLVHDLLELFVRLLDKESRLLRRIPQRSSYVAYTRFYRICQMVLCLSGVLGGCWFYLVKNASSTNVILYLKSINLPFILMGVLYILEPLPVFGYFAITLQRMITAMLKFSALQLLIELTFTIFFMTAETHMAEFQTVDDGLYAMFLLSQNIISFGVTPEWYIRVGHYLHYFIGNILLMNYLIAVMSSLICSNDNERKAIQLIRVLDVCFLVEDRYARWLWKLMRKFKHYDHVAITVAK
ncbi:uncharacterized protein LOC135495503 [Lineus longissimus]|uniref:uncharacterized protein LOC135495503 n=1 Tax=Lineus longissimus TaxID=88925 RepID=UPI002B4FA4A1